MMFDLIVGFAYFVMCIFLFFMAEIFSFSSKPHESETLWRKKKVECKKLIVCDVLFRDKVQHVFYEGHYGSREHCKAMWQLTNDCVVFGLWISTSSGSLGTSRAASSQQQKMTSVLNDEQSSFPTSAIYWDQKKEVKSGCDATMCIAWLFLF